MTEVQERKPLLFKKRDMERAILAATGAGLKIASAEVDPNGKIRLEFADGKAVQPEAPTPFDEWKNARPT
jgi:hypothetical protein